MTCERKFEATVPWGCIAEIIADVRGGGAKPRVLASKAAWVLGCLLESLESVIDVPSVLAERSSQDLAEELEQRILGPDSVVEGPGGETIETSASPAAAIPPEVWAMLLQLLLQLIDEWRKG